MINRLTFSSAWMAILAISCATSINSGTPPSLEPETIEKHPQVTTMQQLSLDHETEVEIVGLNATVKLDFFIGSSAFPGDIHTVTTPAYGALVFTRSGEWENIGFSANESFEFWGHKMLVLEASVGATLIVAPPGQEPVKRDEPQKMLHD